MLKVRMRRIYDNNHTMRVGWIVDRDKDKYRPYLGICFTNLVLSSLSLYVFSILISEHASSLTRKRSLSLDLMAHTAPAALQRQSNLFFTFNSKNSHPLFVFNSYRFAKPLSSSSSSLFSSPLHSSLTPCVSVPRVSTAPIEYVPPAPDFDFQQEIARLRAVLSKLSNSKNFVERLRVVDSDARVIRFFNSHRNGFARALESLNLDEYELFLLKCVVVTGQDHVLVFGSASDNVEFDSPRSYLKHALYSLVEMIDKWDVSHEDFHGKEDARFDEEEVKALRSLLKTLSQIEHFYDCIGGIIGYQLKVLELLTQSTFDGRSVNWSHPLYKSSQCRLVEIHPPKVLDLSKDAEYAYQAALWGIEGLPDLGEIYPLGGSADRLGLVDTATGECLPAAMLPYCGRTLLEGLIRDIQAREFIYFKLYGKQCITPVAIMTSSAKNNHEHIISLCGKLKWFGRGRSSFKLFEQPLVPAINAEDGQWMVTRPLIPVCKPGGHGVIWKLGFDNGIFQWFNDQGRKGVTVRQVSNVVAATDLTLLALAGIGLHHQKKLGFASCMRNPAATEGINVLLEKKNLDGNWAYGLSCIEYTEFEKFGIVDGSHLPNGLQAEFPANTNILYVDLSCAELIGSSKGETCLPGMVLNVNKSITYMDPFGIQRCVQGGRLECTMQNIADNFINTFPSRNYKGVEDLLDTYIVYNERRKVTSSAKKKRKDTDRSLHQTPDGSLLDVIRNACDLLSGCEIKIPKIEGNEKYIDSGPPLIILLHPALGPVWDVTRQKFHGGSITKGSELQIEVAEFLWRNVQLDGSLIVLAENVMGSTSSDIDPNGEPILKYGQRCARCKLENVLVLNDGIDWTAKDNTYWKHDVKRFEALKIILHGNAEFEAVNVTLEGNRVYEVPDGHKLKISSGDAGLIVELNPIERNFMDSGSWFWCYKVKDKQIHLEVVDCTDS